MSKIEVQVSCSKAQNLWINSAYGLHYRDWDWVVTIEYSVTEDGLEWDFKSTVGLLSEHYEISGIPDILTQDLCLSASETQLAEIEIACWEHWDKDVENFGDYYE